MGWQSRCMFRLPTLIAVLSFASFLLACFYVGYINEQLRGAIAPGHRLTVMIGFLLGAFAISRCLNQLAVKVLRKSR